MQRTRFYKMATLFTGAALAAAIVIFGPGWLERNRSGDAQAAKDQKLDAYRYETVRPRQITLTTELPGRVTALMVSEVRPQVSGIITQRMFEEGADVTAGQVLYQIDPAVYEAAHNSAKAALAKAEANERVAGLLSMRYGRIVKTNAISKQDHDDAVAAHEQAIADVEGARQALEAARINLGYTKITAPVSGRIGRSLVTPGALATQHQPEPLATIQQLDKVYVDLTHSNSEILKLRRALSMGQLNARTPDSARAGLRLEDGSTYVHLPVSEEDRLNPKEIKGELLFSEVTIEKSTGVVNIRAIFDNPDKILLPGMYVRALVEEGSRDDAIMVPQKAVMRDTRGRPYVFVLTREAPAREKKETAEPTAPLADDSYYIAMRHVEIDRHYDNQWLLSAGLEPGDRVLAEGLQKVHPGLLITGVETVSRSASETSGQGR